MLSMATGCAHHARRDFTQRELQAARVDGFEGIRFWGDGARDGRALARFMPPSAKAGQVRYLALSGGGSGGAYSAGVLVGWTQTGARPSFDVVSGVSTGALAAPFAFLGPEYDPELEEIYTSGVARSIYNPMPVQALLGTGLWDASPLRRLVERYATPVMLRRVAQEHRKGRRLFVATTNLDAQRTVVWDLGAIAASGTPEALDLFRKIIVASASIPAVLPPVLIEVEAKGRHFLEMHADGGTTTQIFTAPEFLLATMHAAPPIRPRKVSLYAIVNNNIDPEFQVVAESTFAIAGRAYSTFLKTHARLSLTSTYAFTQRTGMRFNLTYPSGTLTHPTGNPFDTEYMRKLFEEGYDRAVSGTAWRDRPPASGDP